jgi:hypothetical protein
LFGRFGFAKSLALPFIFSLSVGVSGKPNFLIAPSGTGKTVVVKAVEKYLEEINYPVAFVDKINLTNLQALNDWLNENPSCVLVNDDFSHIGTSEYNTEKTGSLIGGLSYDKRFKDKAMKIDIEYIERLGFITAIQPYWIKDVVLSGTWITFFRQRFIRYYMLSAYHYGRQRKPSTMINRLIKGMKFYDVPKAIHHNANLKNALRSQLGGGRGQECYDDIRRNIYKFVGQHAYQRTCDLIAERLVFENAFMRRDYNLLERKFIVQTRDIEFTILNIALRYNPLSYKDLARELHLILDEEQANRTLSKLINSVENLKWITRQSQRNKKFSGSHLIVNPEIKQRLCLE